MNVMKRLMYVMLLGIALFASPLASAQTTQPRATRPPAEQNEFVPVNDLPESDKLPAAPYLIAAYTVVWVVLLVYVWSLWRRLNQVEQELKRAVEAAARGE